MTSLAIILFGARPPATAIVGMAIVLVILFAAAFAPWVAPYGEAELVGDVWENPSAAMLLGTDSLGRDMLSRLVYGARTTVGIAAVTTALAFVLGCLLGFTAAVVGKTVDAVLANAVDILLAIPVLISALLVLSVLGTSIPVLIGTIAILESTRVFRVSRAVAMNIAVLEYVEIARLRGEGLGWVISREVLPNALPPLIAEAGLRFCFIFLFIASLSFLGLGIQPPYADWGSMVRENAQAINFGGYAPLFPAAAIALLTVGVNLVVDWLLALHARPGGQTVDL
jgi:peptide/nickel transport system permease protein